MEVKKARRADLEKGKSRWLFMGLIVTLSFMFVSFEWTERNVTYAISDLVSDPDFFEELVPVTYNQDKPLPPPPPPAAVNPEELLSSTLAAARACKLGTGRRFTTS